MSTSPTSNLYSSANNSNSTLRPRAARLISYLNEDEASASTSATVLSSSALNARAVPPNAYADSLVRRGKSLTKEQSRSPSESAERRPANGLWDSWSQIQGIASSILGSDGSNSGLKSPAWMKQDHTYRTTTSAPKWGPKAPSKVGTGLASSEDRQALVQVKKREALLLSTAEDTRGLTGKFKRKGSDASLTIQSPTAESSADALVYRHKVLPNDTMAGITIKYSCQPEVFRKVNRLWPNDRIQIRKHVLLPVEACAIRGRKTEGPTLMSLAGGDQQLESHVSPTGASTPGTESFPDQETTISTLDGEEEGYRHDSWVLFPNFDQPIQILRVSRKALGYFPPARRKSNPQLSRATSANSSPRTSFDTLRHPPSHAAQQAQLQQHQRQISNSVSGSPVRQPSISPRHRSASSNASLSAPASIHHKTTSANTFLKALHGPGGVGNLRGLGTEASRPGPAIDPLNQQFPFVLNLVSAPSLASSPLASEYKDFPPSGRVVSLSMAVPRASIDSLRSTRSGRSNSSVSLNTSRAVSGVEGWIKKLASSGNGRPGIGRTNSDRPFAGNNGVGIGIGGETGLGDLIELEQGTELLSVNTEDTHQRGRKDHQSSVSNDDDGGETPRVSESQSGLNRPATTGMNMSGQETDLLDERFPVRGRITRAYAGD